jgi:hypothetical protein
VTDLAWAVVTVVGVIVISAGPFLYAMLRGLTKSYYDRDAPPPDWKARDWRTKR